MLQVPICWNHSIVSNSHCTIITLTWLPNNKSSWTQITEIISEIFHKLGFKRPQSFSQTKIIVGHGESEKSKSYQKKRKSTKHSKNPIQGSDFRQYMSPLLERKNKCLDKYYMYRQYVVRLSSNHFFSISYNSWKVIQTNTSIASITWLLKISYLMFHQRWRHYASNSCIGASTILTNIPQLER